MMVAALTQTFWQPCWCTGQRILHIWRAYGISHAVYVAVFIVLLQNCSACSPGVWARDFNFAGAVERL